MVLGILDQIDEGRIQPRIPGKFGQFLRQYESARLTIDKVLAARRITRRVDAAVSGEQIGAIEIHPMYPPEVSLLGYPLEEVAETLAISEELGGLVRIVMWLKGPVANACYNLLKQKTGGLCMSGDYRWTPSARLTPGEATIEGSDRFIRWQDARCLKAVADDLIRPPHAVEYMIDYRVGPPGIKYFRCICAIRREHEWHVLPGLTKPRPLETAGPSGRGTPELEVGEMAALLIFREPWSTAWTIVKAVNIDAEQAFAHAVAWADYQREMDGCRSDGALITGIREALRRAGLRISDFGEIDFTRRLPPVARDLVRLLRSSS
ncbi:MAG: hypothetical protein ACRERX_22485 [Pseudomonas sp.]